MENDSDPVQLTVNIRYVNVINYAGSNNHKMSGDRDLYFRFHPKMMEIDGMRWNRLSRPGHTQIRGETTACKSRTSTCNKDTKEQRLPKCVRSSN